MFSSVMPIDCLLILAVVIAEWTPTVSLKNKHLRSMNHDRFCTGFMTAARQIKNFALKVDLVY